MKTKALTFSVKMPSLVGDGSSCSRMHLVGFNGGAIDDPLNGYWALAANFLLPSCLRLPVLSGSTLLMRNRLRAITASRIRHPFWLKKKWDEWVFLGWPEWAFINNPGEWRCLHRAMKHPFIPLTTPAPEKRKKIMCTIRTYEYKGSLNLKVEPIVNLTGISA